MLFTNVKNQRWHNVMKFSRPQNMEALICFEKVKKKNVCLHLNLAVT